MVGKHIIHGLLWDRKLHQNYRDISSKVRGASLNVAHAATICIYEHLRWQGNPPSLLAILWGGAFKLGFGLPPDWNRVQFDLYVVNWGRLTCLHHLFTYFLALAG